MKPHDLGRLGEQLAVDYLGGCGLRILDRNWRCPDGEIDIVAVERQALVVCEVKARSGSTYGSPLEAIGVRKQARLRRLAVRWVIAHGVYYDEIRIDAVGVRRTPLDGFVVEHIRGVR